MVAWFIEELPLLIVPELGAPDVVEHGAVVRHYTGRTVTAHKYQGAKNKSISTNQKIFTKFKFCFQKGKSKSLPKVSLNI